jgi:hypothetical protein
MKNLFGILVSLLLVSCSLVSKERSEGPSRIERVILASNVAAFEFASRDYRKTVYTIPAGDYARAQETKHAVYFLNSATEVLVSWPNWKNRARPDRSAPGGVMFSKSRGLWFVFTLGSHDEMDVEGEPPIVLKLEDTIDGRLVNLGALLGRTDKNGRLVHLETSPEATFYGEPENLQAITLVATSSPQR